MQLQPRNSSECQLGPKRRCEAAALQSENPQKFLITRGLRSVSNFYRTNVRAPHEVLPLKQAHTHRAIVDRESGGLALGILWDRECKRYLGARRSRRVTSAPLAKDAPKSSSHLSARCCSRDSSVARASIYTSSEILPATSRSACANIGQEPRISMHVRTRAPCTVNAPRPTGLETVATSQDALTAGYCRAQGANLSCQCGKLKLRP